MRVFRIEDNDGNGPFYLARASWTLHEAMGLNPHAETPYHDQFMTPDEEGLNFTSDHKCGCSSPRQLVKWFPRKARNWLAQQGYSFAIYEVPESQVQIGEHQVIYVSA